MGAQSLLEEHIAELAGLGCSRFVVVGAPAIRETVEGVAAALAIRLRFVRVQSENGSLAAAFVAAEPALSHFATGPVLVTQPHYVAGPGLHRDLLEAWSARSSGVDGVVAGIGAGVVGPSSLRLVQRDGRLVDCVLATEPDGAEALEYGGAMVYASSRELCETAGEEADKRGPAGALARAFSRLMAWTDLRALIYDGPLVRLRRPADLLELIGLAPSGEPAESVDGRATILGRVVFGSGCRVEAGALVEGSVLGAGCVVRSGAVVRHSLLGASVELGERSSVTRAVLDSGCRVEAEARIGVDSFRLATVVGAGASIGRGSTIPAGAAIGPAEVIEAGQVVELDAGRAGDSGENAERQGRSAPAVRPRLHFER
jgi:carbonic anhydrase/acetyltransferase-like protein (isoleucine patch superfamily)